MVAPAVILQSSVLQKERMSRGTKSGNMDILLVPDDSGHSKDLLSNGDNTVVCITIRGAPECRNATTGGVVDDLHGPTKLTDDLEVGEGSHVGMSPGMDGNVICI